MRKIGKGWRAKLGFLVPAVNTVGEPEFVEMAPEGVTVHSARLESSENEHNVENLTEMSEDTERAVKAISAMKPDSIIYACTSGTFVNGAEWNRDLEDTMEEISGAPCATTTTAMCEGLEEMGVKKVTLVTPYGEEVTELEGDYLESEDFEVVSSDCLGVKIRGGQDKYAPYQVYRLAKSADTEESDGVFISCTNFRTIEILQALEKDLGKPAVSSNSASMWKSLKLANVSEPIEGFGELLTSF
ncbi:hypothetical protein AKJ62_02660 [candidate division MSBL1 archaeon SCGC-AAA259D14]|uniref:Maleate cis-trans isomerase n=1 Tax=candidate division MSBL1 archaeon SCGC-AAA259D14 TaxID=1698261 RepID=A0A133U660_9EURY|nr:hypothetical protein AKJ62_02660 [candidate division MSBL1 archaeon SCGC-AAA259D14]